MELGLAASTVASGAGEGFGDEGVQVESAPAGAGGAGGGGAGGGGAELAGRGGFYVPPYRMGKGVSGAAGGSSVAGGESPQQYSLENVRSFSASAMLLADYLTTKAITFEKLRLQHANLNLRSMDEIKQIYFPKVHLERRLEEEWNKAFKIKYTQEFIKGIITAAVIHKYLVCFDGGFKVLINSEVYRARDSRKHYHLKCTYVSRDNLFFPSLEVNQDRDVFPEQHMMPFRYAGLDPYRFNRADAFSQGMWDGHILDADRYKRIQFLTTLSVINQDSLHRRLLRAITDDILYKSVIHCWYINCCNPVKVKLQESFMVPLYDTSVSPKRLDGFCPLTEKIEDVFESGWVISTVLPLEYVLPLMCNAPVREQITFMNMVYPCGG
ncbi:MAG: hypothetical protein WCJ17_02020 [bacterium]